MSDHRDLHVGPNDFAVIGMAAQLPGAEDVTAFWRNLCAGVESIQPVSREDLLARGESPATLADPNYVPAAAILDQFDEFDAEFFGLSPKDAAIMDPQHRKFLETCWHGLEDAGQMPENFDGPIGVYAGCGMGSYFYFNICANRELVDSVGHFLLRHTGNDKDFLSTRVSHIFNLTGPSVNVQTACSTSLVALHMACQSLGSGECDMALAGGVTIEMPHGRGYLYKENEILSPDGHCHAFDHRAEGTVFGSGAAVLVLRRLADALADGDKIRAIIRGSAINNDGSSKAGYLAPSVEGQAQAVAEALVMSDCAPDSIGYIECHGTGTALGDPIEIAALNQAFARVPAAGEREGPCYVGSVKTNIGHLDTAAGAAGLIKTIRALEEGVIPPTLGFEAPNPAIDFDGGPFTVADRLIDWRPTKGPRRAGINSLGVGGTNAHVVLEQPPAPAPSEAADWPFQIFAVSGRSKNALDANAEKLAGWLVENPATDPADLSHTLINRRRAFERRRVLVAQDATEAAELLASGDPYRVFDHQSLGDDPEVVFMLPGGGSQYALMARDLYQTEPVFRDWMDRGLDHLATISDHPIREIWLATDGDVAKADQRLLQPSVQLPLLMITEYALAQQWMGWGVQPAALIGHSMGENTAAAIAGVMRFEDCVGLVHLRGRLFDTVPEGGMLSVPMPADQLRAILPADLDLGAVNAGDLCVVSGPKAPLQAFAATLAGQGIEAQVIPISIAAHSRMLEPILADFGAYLRSIPLSAPQIPIISNRDGQVLPDADAMDPDYWVRHLRGTVEFAAGITTLAEGDPKIFLEVGPGRAMSALAQANPGVKGFQVISSLRHPKHQVADDLYFMTALARIWAAGGRIDWSQIWGEARRNALSLPGYAFQRKRYFVEPSAGAQPVETALMRIEEPEGWGWRPSWRLSAPDVELVAGGLPAGEAGQGVLIFADEAGLADRVANLLRHAGHPTAIVRTGDRFERLGRGDYRLPPEEQRDGYEVLLAALQADDIAITRIGHFWSVTTGAEARAGSSLFQDQMNRGFFSPLHLAQALGDEMVDQPLALTAFSNDALRVSDEPAPTPEKATVLGPLRVMPREYPGLSTRLVDLRLPAPARRILPFGPRGDQAALDLLALQMAQELLATPAETGSEVAAWRGGQRFVQRISPVRLQPAEGVQTEGVTFITGGFGGLGQAIARDLAARGGAKLALLSREALGQDGAVPFSARARQMAAFLRELQAAGADAIAVTGDVTSPEDMRRALAETRAHFGRIDTVIHAAGLINDALMAGKSDGEAWDVLAPKVHGTKALIAAFDGQPPRQTVLFASTSTASAPAGQVDYVAANEFLNAVARAAPPALGRVVAVNWGVWSDTGMAARAMGADTAPQPLPVDPAPEADGGPMLGSEVTGRRGVREFHRLFSVADWVIGGHRTAQGQALMPGTGNLELFVQALVATGTPLPLVLNNALFLRPLYVSDTEPTAVAVQIETVEGASRITITDPDGGESYATAMAEAAKPQDRHLQPPADWDEQAKGDAALASAQDRVMKFGPRWRVLRSTRITAGEGWAELQLPAQYSGEAATHLMHPALLDIATGWAMKLIPGWGGARLWVPVGYERFTLFHPLGDHLLSHIRLQTGGAEGSARFDVTLALPDGTVCAEIEGFTLRRMEAGLNAATAARPAKGADTPGEKRLRHNVSQGIPGALGPDVLRRAMALGLPQVYVTSLDLPGLVAEAAMPAVSAPASEAAFERPDLDAEFVAPAPGTESELASIWSDLLGVRQIGAGDSFFDLGGHSLVAVRMFGQVRKVFGVDFPISTLFEAPNVGKLAALIEARVGPRAGTPAAAGVDGGAAPVQTGPARRYVVDMGGRGGGTPFFIVAGMFGNVMNLHQMAQRVGQDRRFYGLQARGLFGDDKPHESFAEAARDYLAEIRQIQPQGPYLLGGFSGGGLIALEMARFLAEAGEETAMLVMLDTPLPMREALSRRDKVLIRAQEMREQGLTFWSDWAKNKLAYEISKRRKERVVVGETAEPEGFHDLAIEAAFRGALPKVAMQEWPGPATLFRPPLDYRYKVSDGQFVSAGREYLIPDNGWSRWMPRLEVHEVPGDHDSMVLEPNVRRLGALLREILRRHDRGGDQQSAAAE